MENKQRNITQSNRNKGGRFKTVALQCQDIKRKNTRRHTALGKSAGVDKFSFRGRRIPQAFCHAILVLIPKSEQGKYRGIALLETIYKLISTIIDTRLKEAIEFDDALHGFIKKRGTGTAIMEVKLLMQLVKRGIKHCIWLL